MVRFPYGFGGCLANPKIGGPPATVSPGGTLDLPLLQRLAAWWIAIRSNGGVLAGDRPPQTRRQAGARHYGARKTKGEKNKREGRNPPSCTLCGGLHVRNSRSSDRYGGRIPSPPIIPRSAAVGCGRMTCAQPRGAAAPRQRQHSINANSHPAAFIPLRPAVPARDLLATRANEPNGHWPVPNGDSLGHWACGSRDL